MGGQTNRRRFLQGTVATGAGYWVAGRLHAEDKAAKSPNERIQFGCIGVDGKGRSDSQDAAKHGDIVAICDIDDQKLEAAAKRKGFGSAKRFHDFNEMLDKMGSKLDAVTVSTPDHCHAAASVKAMKMGLHCFCQKPLARTASEARTMGQVAREMGVATQMGNQGTALGKMRKAAAEVKAGLLGDVPEVHVWTNRPIWPTGGERPAPQRAPDGLHWDLWLGPAPYRPYGRGYHPFAWRGWWDFGSGALGDMGCHTMNLPFRALDLRDPISVAAESPGHNGDSFTPWSIVTYEFPTTDTRAAVKMIWYEGGKMPPPELFDGVVAEKSGVLFVGSKAKLYVAGDYADHEHKLLGDVEPVDVQYRKSPGHFQEWVDAIRGGDPAQSNFPDYAAPLAETVVLGNLAIWAGKKVQWDAKELKVTNGVDVDGLVRPEYRAGYAL